MLIGLRYKRLMAKMLIYMKAKLLIEHLFRVNVSINC